MTAVCSVGIDMVIIPGDTTPAVISALIADERRHRHGQQQDHRRPRIPAIGRKAGEVLDFGACWATAPSCRSTSVTPPSSSTAAQTPRPDAVAEELSALYKLSAHRLTFA